jgi:hypothetical protein
LGSGAEMAARLGKVLYWLGCIVAILMGLLTALAAYAWHMHEWSWGDEVNRFAVMVCPAIGLGSWLVGRAALHMLAGR